MADKFDKLYDSRTYLTKICHTGNHYISSRHLLSHSQGVSKSKVPTIYYYTVQGSQPGCTGWFSQGVLGNNARCTG